MCSLVLNNKSVSRLLYWQVILAFFLPFLVDELHFPDFVSYGLDIFNLFITLFLLYSKNVKRSLRLAKLSIAVFSVILLLLYVVVNGILHFVKPQLIIWALRKTFRFYPFFFAIVALWDEKMIGRMYLFLDALQLPNFLIVLFQFFILGYEQDSIGGIFGHTSGCNGYLNLYFCIVTIMSIERYIHRETKLISVVLCMCMVVVSSVVAELKVIFVEIPLIILLAVLLNRPSPKTILAAIFMGAAVLLGWNIIQLVFPHWSYAFSSFQALVNVGNETSGGYNISRLSAISDINSILFHGDILKNLFGLGFGNCEYSSISFLTSAFFQEYGYLHYQWFTHQIWFLECGIIGILAYFAFFAVLFLWVTKQKKKHGDNSGMGTSCQLLIVIIAMHFIYNNALRAESGYILFAALALPCAYYRCKYEKQ